ncbi:hypothetical protein SEA_JABBERWOCKY_78 [Gordonia phage Jabberwocky]|uniref:Uncharacterized protein n=1 Tax=Gordonia phage Jabberwocky TaxID=2653273 RepID=A0A5P8D527_9CAUD|nr:hypothetical protein KNU76_gp78 [Gordonia phage Jabberwocky]QFP94133.1 hypothetical protein SEA_JABBERWOCKY_78 [Gordonia phage Jabberwocky]
MSEVVNYSARLDEMRAGTVIRNGEGGTTCHFVKQDDDRWYPSDVAGEETGSYPAGHASSRVFLPAVVVDAAEITVQLVAKKLDEFFNRDGVLTGTEATQTAEVIARRLSNAKLLAN